MFNYTINNEQTHMSSSKHYINSSSLRLELIASNVKNELTPKCLEMLLLMIDNIQSSYTYKDEADKDDCRSAAIEVILKKWKEYDVDKNNPFAFFTRMIYNGLFAGWNEIKGKGKSISLESVFNESI